MQINLRFSFALFCLRFLAEMIDELARLLGEIVVNRTTDSGSEGQIT